MFLRERVGTEFGLMSGRIKKSLLNGRDNVSNARIAVTERTRRAARKTDYFVHDNAWKMIGIVAGAAFVTGFLLSRRSEERYGSDLHSGQSPQVQGKAKRSSSWEMIHSAIPLALFFWKARQSSRCEKRGEVTV